MSDESRDRDDLWDGTDADDEPEPFVAGVDDDRPSAPEGGDERPREEPSPALDDGPGDGDRFEIGDDDFDLAELEAAVAELGIEDDEEPASLQAEPGLFEQRRQPSSPPPTPTPPTPPRSEEPAAPPEAPPVAPPTAVPAASAEEAEQAGSIAALWDLASEPTPEETAEPDVPGDEPPTDQDALPDQPEEEASPGAEDEPEVAAVPEPSEVGLDLTNFTAKGGSGAAGQSSKRRKGLFRR